MDQFQKILLNHQVFGEKLAIWTPAYKSLQKHKLLRTKNLQADHSQNEKPQNFMKNN